MSGYNLIEVSSYDNFFGDEPEIIANQQQQLEDAYDEDYAYESWLEEQL